jgi:hypothetical protein
MSITSTPKIEVEIPVDASQHVPGYLPLGAPGSIAEQKITASQTKPT